MSTTPHPTVMRVTRWVAAAVILFLLDAAQILLLAPDRTAELFAWPIDPEITSMVLGAAYVGGGYYFARVVLDDGWHRVAAGLPPVILFVWLAALATALHTDKFTPGLPFAAWAAIYAVAPIGLPLLLVAQRRAAPPDVALPRTVRLALGAVGAAVTLAALAAFTLPSAMAEVWPWTLTPLTARIVATVAALFGAVWLSVAATGGRTAARIPLQSHAIGLAFLLLAAARGGEDVDWTNPLAAALVAGAAALLAADLWLIRPDVSLQRALAPRAGLIRFGDDFRGSGQSEPA